MSNFEEMFRNAQAKHLAKAQEEIRQLHADLRHLQKYEKGGIFYHRIQSAILTDEILMDSWQQFCVLLRLSCPDIEKPDEEFPHCKTCRQPIRYL